MKKLYVNGKIVATGDFSLEIKEEAPKYRLEIKQDDDPTYPFTYGGGTAFFSNMRSFDPEGRRLDTLLDDDGKIAKPEPEKYAYFKIYGYNHSGICLSSTPFACRFDSGLAGVLRLNKHEIDDLPGAVDAWVDQVNAYLNGDVFAFVVYDETWGVVDSCGGFYDKGSMLDYIGTPYGITKEDIEKAWGNRYA